MDANRSGLILHPIRLRVLMAVSGKTMTTKEIAAEIGDVSKPTVYRHVADLIEGRLLKVAREERVRGAIRRYLELAPELDALGSVNDPEPAWTVEALAAYLFSMLHRYADSNGQAPIWAQRLVLSDAEATEISRRFYTSLTPLRERDADADHTTRLVTFMMVPEEEAGPNRVPATES